MLVDKKKQKSNIISKPSCLPALQFVNHICGPRLPAVFVETGMLIARLSGDKQNAAAPNGHKGFEKDALSNPTASSGFLTGAAVGATGAAWEASEMERAVWISPPLAI